ncbi:hypothetical protein LTR56_001401 [Elasticomyces elasticus]|nr:hypothetical protein LTR56_001401 [Elasticomyces elasticus]KAK3668676.1 hypothetical protein LTR22_000563 [Elasticomyces elasticus]KAK4932028.1 hypothetical protein LTR49_001715 [Elasticomyces elasticus]KAK5768441.1 hypothetical protein LTS12_001229 [Elasticomyces elasticus]
MASMANEQALQQQLDEALKVADYLKQKLDSLEDIIDDLSEGQDVKAVFKGYSDDMENLERTVLKKAEENRLAFQIALEEWWAEGLAKEAEKDRMKTEALRLRQAPLG